MSALPAVSYNDSMRLGQGYNSFLQVPCLLNAVDIQPKSIAATQGEGQPQTVSYTSRIVSKISEVARAMHITAGSAIRSGSVSASNGSGDIDETKFGESDLNVVVSVKVVNQTQAILEDVKFTDMDNGEMNGERFHQTYGDAFISGFIEGGDLHGIISIRTIDASRRKEVKSAILSQLNASTSDWSPALHKPFEEVMRLAEVTVSVNWSGGGNINATGEEWTLTSLLDAASNFPRNVAKCPQRTCAILSRYDTIPGFAKYAIKNSISLRQYDSCQRFASDLLDMHMEYKTNLSILNHAIHHVDRYTKGQASDAVELSVKALVEERKQMKAEMSKLVDIVERLNIEPESRYRWEMNLNVKSPEIWRTLLPTINPPSEASSIEKTFEDYLGALPIVGARPAPGLGSSGGTSITVPGSHPHTDEDLDDLPSGPTSSLCGQLKSGVHYNWKSEPNYSVNVDVKFQQNYTKVPQVLLGMNAFSLLGPNVTKIGCKLLEVRKSGFTAQMSTFGGQVARSNAMNWAMIPPTKLHFETGIVDTTGEATSINYGRPFKNTPKVYTWFVGIDSITPDVEVRTSAYSLGLDSFTAAMNPDFWSKTGGHRINTARIGYLAYDPAEVGDRITVVESTINIPSEKAPAETSWDKEFPADPAVFIGIKQIGYQSAVDTCVSAEYVAADKTTFSWKASTHEDVMEAKKSPDHHAYVDILRFAIAVEDHEEIVG